MKYLIAFVSFWSFFVSFIQAQNEEQTVIILGIDGLNVFRFEEAETPKTTKPTQAPPIDPQMTPHAA